MKPADSTRLDGWALTVGGMTRAALVEQLHASGIRLNVHAEILLHGPAFDEAGEAEEIVLVERSVDELGFPNGASLSRVLDEGVARGLQLCPASTGPYLRLAWGGQTSAADAVLSSGRAPSGSLTVASPVSWADPEAPKGFYVRVVERQPWLRGYRCDDEHLWSPEDRFAFRSVR